MERKRAPRKRSPAGGARRKPAARARAKSVPVEPVAALAVVEQPSEPPPPPAPPKGRIEQLRDALFELVSDIPASQEPASTSPAARARSLTLRAASQAAVISGSLALPPGLLGLLTILPELQLIWRTQAQLVADIAAVYGKSYQLGKRQMIFCLFRHVAGHLVRDVVVRAGERFLVRPATQQVMRRLLQRIGLQVAERAASRALTRLVPVVGAVGVGGYAFYDTRQVGQTAIALFEREIVEEEPGGKHA
jgi:hypothetical protein